MNKDLWAIITLPEEEHGDIIDLPCPLDMGVENTLATDV